MPKKAYQGCQNQTESDPTIVGNQIEHVIVGVFRAKLEARIAVFCMNPLPGASSGSEKRVISDDLDRRTPYHRSASQADIFDRNRAAGRFSRKCQPNVMLD